MPHRVYPELAFPSPPDGRPWVAINMITTLDGKILSGERNEPVMDLGSASDHQALRDIENAADAVMTGAETLRATPKIWYPSRLVRVTLTRSGNLPWESRFFTDAPEQSIVVTPPESTLAPPEGVSHWTDPLPEVLRRLRVERGVQAMVVEGGSELNAAILSQDLADELFLTLAPKVKLGRDIPTYAGGDALPRAGLLNFELVSAIPVESELFLRYRRRREWP